MEYVEVALALISAIAGGLPVLWNGIILAIEPLEWAAVIYMIVKPSMEITDFLLGQIGREGGLE